MGCVGLDRLEWDVAGLFGLMVGVGPAGTFGVVVWLIACSTGVGWVGGVDVVV